MVPQNQLLTLHIGYRCSKYIEFHKNSLPMNLSQAIFAYEVRPTDVVESILSQVLSSGTQVNYVNQNADLILWI